MARTDVHLDAMLRHLGAAYYESLHGRAARSDVTRALDTVEEHLKEQAPHAGTGRSPAVPHQARAVRPAGAPRRRWARRVSDVMTTSVVTVDRYTSYQEIDRLLAEHRISGVPVLTMGRQVAGVVSEADLLAAEDRKLRQGRAQGPAHPHWRVRPPGHTGLNAATLMTAPAVTIGPDATIPGAARLMNTHHVRRLPVVDADGKLVGVVSRRDLLSVFLRPDEDVRHDARQVLDEIPFPDPSRLDLVVRHGVITLTGKAQPATGHDEDLVALAVRLLWDIDGVVDVANRVGKPAVTPA